MLDQFIEITRAIIEKDGLDNYLPTLLLPEQRKVFVLDEIPEDVNVEHAAVEWAVRTAEDDAFFLAFRLDDSHFKVIAGIDGAQHEQVCAVGPAPD